MVAALLAIVVPSLRAAGYTGTFPHFRRQGPNGIDLLTFQFDRNGGGFVVEVSSCHPEGITMHWGKVIAPGDVTAWDVHPSQRFRIQPQSGGGTEYWFRFEDEKYDHVARQALEHIDATVKTAT